ncbi:hypothetical protein P3G55_20550 [Leptospira sp. 96542]|nr:hypothetical protein [Leptospira sp. 96542]
MKKESKRYRLIFFFYIGLWSCISNTESKVGNDYKFVLPSEIRSDESYGWKITSVDNIKYGSGNGFVVSISKSDIIDESQKLEIIKQKRIPFECKATFRMNITGKELQELDIYPKDLYIKLQSKQKSIFYFNTNGIVNTLVNSILILSYPISHSFGDYPFCEISLSIERVDDFLLK